MKALITGASSGLGWEMAHILAEKGYSIIAVARRKDRLLKLQEELSCDVEIIVMDLTDEAACRQLAKRAGEVDVFINNAGFGVFGEFVSTDIDAELKMLDTNVRAVHILTKLVLKVFKERNYGYILNVASLAAFFSGPLFASYYASKAYVYRLSVAISEELRKEKSKVKISVLCPGPVSTEFGDVAKVNFGLGKEKGKKFVVLDSFRVSKYAIEKMLRGKTIIIPGMLMKIAAFLRRILPEKLMAKVVCLIQREKCIVKD